MPATIKDIAAYTGLGVATISSYLNGGNVRQKNREKIETAIQILDYEINETARGLKTNKTRTVGILIPDFNNIFFSQIVTIIEERMQRAGYATILCSCHNDADLEREKALFLSKKRVDGLFSIPIDASGEYLTPLQVHNKPCILVDRALTRFDCDAVLVDNVSAAKMAMEEFLIRGHKKIGIIGGPDDISTARERLMGCQLALTAAGIAFEKSLFNQSDYTIKGGIEGIAALVGNNPDMTAVFTANYETTVGTMIGLNELGLTIPGDISMIGYDDLDFARAVHPRLTIVTQPVREIAENASDIMLKRLSGKQSPFRLLKLKADIVTGKSIKDLTVQSL